MTVGSSSLRRADPQNTERETNISTVAALLSEESAFNLPLVSSEPVAWFQIACDPPLSRRRLDEASHLVADFLAGNGYRRGFVRKAQEPDAYESNKVDVLRWRAVRLSEADVVKIQMSDAEK
jgi:hypothetical protein